MLVPNTYELRNSATEKGPRVSLILSLWVCLHCYGPIIVIYEDWFFENMPYWIKIVRAVARGHLGGGGDRAIQNLTIFGNNLAGKLPPKYLGGKSRKILWKLLIKYNSLKIWKHFDNFYKILKNSETFCKFSIQIYEFL